MSTGTGLNYIRDQFEERMQKLAWTRSLSSRCHSLHYWWNPWNCQAGSAGDGNMDTGNILKPKQASSRGSKWLERPLSMNTAVYYWKRCGPLERRMRLRTLRSAGNNSRKKLDYHLKGFRKKYTKTTIMSELHERWPLKLRPSLQPYIKTKLPARQGYWPLGRGWLRVNPWLPTLLILKSLTSVTVRNRENLKAQATRDRRFREGGLLYVTRLPSTRNSKRRASG